VLADSARKDDFEMQPPADFALSISRITAPPEREQCNQASQIMGRIQLEILYGARQSPANKIGLFPGFLMMSHVCKNLNI
jgi:hypothetical protein